MDVTSLLRHRTDLSSHAGRPDGWFIATPVDNRRRCALQTPQGPATVAGGRSLWGDLSQREFLSRSTLGSCPTPVFSRGLSQSGPAAGQLPPSEDVYDYNKGS